MRGTVLVAIVVALAHVAPLRASAAADSCAAAPEGAPCDDGDPCTHGDACAGGACVGFDVACSVADPRCSVGLCDEEGVCVASPVHEGDRCDDGARCTTFDTCTVGVCVGVVADCRGSNAPPCDDVTCNPDVDNDFDGVKDTEDSAPLNPRACRDTDGDGCDDCALTGPDESGGDPRADGPDADHDGVCDAGDATPRGDDGCRGAGGEAGASWWPWLALLALAAGRLRRAGSKYWTAI